VATSQSLRAPFRLNSGQPETGRNLLLAAGEQATAAAQAVHKIVHPDVSSATAWTHQQIILKETPLTDVVRQFNRYNVRPLVIADPLLNDIPISGVFSSANPRSLLLGLEGLGQFKVHEFPDRVEISAR
jgi:transmembrane sensor